MSVQPGAEPSVLSKARATIVSSDPWIHITAPMGSGPVKGAGGPGPVMGLLCWLLVVAREAGPQPGARWSAHWTNDLAAGEDRRRIVDEKARTTVDDVAEMARMHPFGPQGGAA